MQIRDLEIRDLLSSNHIDEDRRPHHGLFALTCRDDDFLQTSVITANVRNINRRPSRQRNAPQDGENRSKKNKFEASANV
jgi:hypothetical protein